MSLRFILGPAGSGKTRHILDAVREEILRSPLGPPVLILVPEQSVTLVEQTLLSGSVTGSFRLQVTSFRRLAHRGRSLWGRSDRPVGALFEYLVLWAACESERSGFRYYGNVAVTTGFVRAVTTALRELRRYRAFKTALNPRQRDTSVAKWNDLLAIESILRRSLPPGRCLSDDVLDNLIEVLPQWESLALSRLFVDGFSTFTGQEEEALIRLIGRVRTAEIALCLDPADLPEDETDPSDGRLFSPTEETYRRLKKMCGAAGISLDNAQLLPRGHHFRFQGSAALTRIEAAWRGENTPEFDARPNGVSLAVCPDHEAEVRLAADGILRLVQEKGFRYREIGVIVRTLDPFESLIRREFSRKDIPFLLPGLSPIGDHPAVNLLRTTARVLTDRWEEDSVRDYLKNDLCPVEREEADRLEKALVREGIYGENLFDEDRWRRFGEESAVLREISGRAFGPLRDLERGLVSEDGAISPRGFAEALTGYLEVLRVAERLDKEDLNREESKRVWGHIVSLIDDLLELPDVPTKTDILFDCLVRSLEELGGPASTITLDHVSVGAVDRSRMGDLRAVFILGMNEGIFPAPVSESMLLNDRDREVLRESGIRLGPTSVERLSHEGYLAYVALTRSSEFLTVTCSANGDDGHPLNPSPYFERLAEMLPSSVMLEAPSEMHVPSPDRIRHVADFASAYLKAANRKEDFAPQPAKKEGEGEVGRFPAPSSRETWDAIRCALQREAKTWRFGSPFDSLLYGNRAHLKSGPGESDLEASVSSLEKYASCPFQYFAARTLGLREPEIYEPDPKETGNLVHSVLERLFRRIEKDGLDWSDIPKEQIPELVGEALGLSAPRHRHGLFLSTGASRHALNTLERHLVDLVRELAERAKVSKFRQISAELTFGMYEDSPLPPLVLPIGEGQVLRLRGKIDRVDRAAESDAFIVIDYKLSAGGVGAIDPAKVKAGLEIQLLSYLLVLKELGSGLFGSGHPEPAAAFYLNVVRGPSTGPPSEEKGAPPRKARGILADSAVRDLETSSESGHSRYYSFQVKTDGDLAKNGDYVSAEYLVEILHTLPRILTDLGRQILKRDISVRPYLYKGETPCGKCSFRSLCRFDVASRYGGYRRIEKSRWEEVVEDVNYDGPVKSLCRRMRSYQNIGFARPRGISQPWSKNAE